jgi:hypothetical protein
MIAAGTLPGKYGSVRENFLVVQVYNNHTYLCNLTFLFPGVFSQGNIRRIRPDFRILKQELDLQLHVEVSYFVRPGHLPATPLTSFTRLVCPPRIGPFLDCR